MEERAEPSRMSTAVQEATTVAIDMKALSESLTPVTKAEAEAAMAAGVAAHFKKHGRPSKDAVCLESPEKAVDNDDVDDEPGEESAASPG